MGELLFKHPASWLFIYFCLLSDHGQILLQEEIKRAYENRNPHEILLKFCYNLKESLDNKSLSRTFLEMLCFIQNPVLTDELKIHAFNYFSQTSRSGIAMAARAFRLKDSKEMFIEKVKHIAKHPWVCQAGKVALEMKLCEELPIDLILIPLFLENKSDIYFEYMDASPVSRVKMLKFLDSLMKSNDAYSTYLFQNNVKEALARNRKMIKTHIFKVRERYQLEECETPIATQYHYAGFMRYIMTEYYDCEKLSKEIYEDKITEIANKGVELQQLLVKLTDERGYGRDADKWKKHYMVDVNISTFEQIEEFKQTPENDSYYKLPIGISRIIFVDNENKFEEMLLKITGVETVGLDCEQQINNDLSIIQIATKDSIFIIDSMCGKFNWEKFIDAFFNNYKITKLGCEILHDLKTIEKFLSIKIDESASYIDLGRLGQKLKTVKDFKFPFEEEEREENRPGLSKLTKLCLGKSLNKALAISNWSIRPLREEQLIYAALDAFVAIEIIDKIKEILDKANLSYEDIYYNENEETKGKKKKR